MPNRLQYETSPYLRQHQHNPVDWYPWGDEALAEAKATNKLLIVSIGYSACHWCHVMERESFENPEVAEVMNRHFVPVKIDREERPDIDQIYMIAVQRMTSQGGWPLNCICLPDGRPIYGGTYFRPADWKNVLLQLADMWRETPQVALDYAERLTSGIKQSEQLPIGRIPEAYTQQDLEAIVTPWKRQFDKQDGVHARVPKFPLPNNWLFLLRYGVVSGDHEVLEHVHFTLKKIASGGIYDQVGGGFARYSVDAEWHVPHFEKMLYDNAQLLELYAEAAVALDEPAYREVARGIAAFVERELSAGDGLAGGYCSALDADSEGEEGAFYVWTRAELSRILGDRFPVLADLFGVHVEADGGAAHWEHGRHVLVRRFSVAEWAARHGMTPEAAARLLDEGCADLLHAREERERPLRDDKVLTGWNGLMIAALARAGTLLDDPALVARARRAADLLLEKARRPDGGLWRRGHTEGGAGSFGIDAFLEDYACFARGLIALYQATFEERYLTAAHGLALYALKHCSDAPDAQ